MRCGSGFRGMEVVDATLALRRKVVSMYSFFEEYLCFYLSKVVVLAWSSGLPSANESRCRWSIVRLDHVMPGHCNCEHFPAV